MSSFSRKQGVKILLALIDVFILYVSFSSAYSLRFESEVPLRNIEPFFNMFPWFIIASLVIFYFFDLYSGAGRKDFHQFVYSIVLAEALFTLVLVAISFWVREFAIPRGVILVAVFLQLISILIVRSFVWFIQYRLEGKKQVLIIGKQMEDGIQVAEKFLEHTKGWFEIKAFHTIDEKKNISKIIQEVDVILLTSDLTKEEKAEMLSYSSMYQKEVLLVPDLYELFLMGAETQQVDDMLVFSILPPTLSSSERAMKRLLDIVVSTVMLVVVSPVMIALMVIIPLTSKGKAIYSQERLGKDEKPYRVFKFRSMVQDAEMKTGPVLASEDDPRITRIGKFMRATRLDELPQLFNVIKGDMSLVGPRPERAFFIEQFKEKMPDYSYRMTVKPGVTGLAQVMAKYSTTAEDKLRYDLMYIRNYSLIQDFKILFQTVLVVLQPEQAKGLNQEEGLKKHYIQELLKVKQSKVGIGK